MFSYRNEEHIQSISCGCTFAAQAALIVLEKDANLEITFLAGWVSIQSTYPNILKQLHKIYEDFRAILYINI